MKTVILWFRNDLRIHDHPALAAAVADADQVIPLFILDDKLLKSAHASSNRNRFLLQSLEDLKQSLTTRGSNLFVREGVAETELVKLAQETGAEAVFYTTDYTPYARDRDHRVKQKLDKAGVAFHGYPGRLAIDTVQGITTQKGKVVKVFTPFWKQWQQTGRRELATTPQTIKSPSKVPVGELPDISEIHNGPSVSPDALAGGETAGRKRLTQWLNHGIKDYHDKHNNLADDATSRLSPYLHFGCLSVREIETRLAPGKGAEAFHRQLAWRDFYHYILLQYPDNLDQELQERYRDFSWDTDKKLLQAWQQGKTGYPVVDAAMRQLNQEGWMHNRARLIVGSFLTKDLLLDWRLGQRYFMQMLLDGDQANNNGNWQWIASVGVDPAPVFRRLYNPSRQQASYDPDGIYVRTYVPELKAVPDTYLAEPWKMPPDMQQTAKCQIGKDYPEPIVNHAEQRKIALEKYQSA